MPMIPIGKVRTGCFLCKICRHFYPKKDIKYIGRKHIRICRNCLEKTKNKGSAKYDSESTV